jgi:hypothetical protein
MRLMITNTNGIVTSVAAYGLSGSSRITLNGMSVHIGARRGLKFGEVGAGSKPPTRITRAAEGRTAWQKCEDRHPGRSCPA